MAAPTNHWKLGLFVVVAFVVAMASIVALGARSLKKTTVSYKTYYDESVQGLDVGSPVKFRGVTIGSVSVIDVAPDHRHVETTLELDVQNLTDLGLSTVPGEKARINVPPDLRAQLGSSGITGVKFISIDFFSIKDNPVEALPFPVPENTIPSAQSTMKNLEDSVVHAVDRFPEVADQIVHLLGQMSRMLDALDEKHLGDRAGDTVNNVNSLVEELRVALRGVDTVKLSQEAQETMTNLNTTLARTTSLLDRLQGDKGVIASTERASNAVGDMAHGARGLGVEIEATLRDVQGAAASVQRLGDALERDPDMLLKGRSKGTR
jgi:phospholipid/cholesterol/gamma-HCH transport system substrate-binding protein